MGEIISLSKVRKARARAERQAEAEANRLKFGRTKGEKDRVRLEETRADRAHESHKLDDEPA